MFPKHHSQKRIDKTVGDRRYEEISWSSFDQFQHGYYIATEKAGQAWNAGKDLMKGK